MEKFSVLMSLYYKEKKDNLKLCLDSIFAQTVIPDEIVIVKDGKLTDELEEVLKEYISKNRDLYKIVSLKENQGLGLALANGILACSNNLVARMDTDDICVPDRFELLLKEFEIDEELDICGSNIAEFEDFVADKNLNILELIDEIKVNRIVAKRTVPLDNLEIRKYQKYRDAFNHMAVMFKKDTVLRAGNYQHALYMEDTLLWANMLKINAKAKNIDKNLVLVRIGKDMFKRRGGFSYFKDYKNGRKKVLATGYINIFEYYISLIIQFIVALVPNSLRGFIFKKILHR